jgi:hypothetical protein
VWAIDQAALELGIKQIPFDRPDRQENFKKTNYFERQERYNKQLNKWWSELYESDPNSIDAATTQLLEYAMQAEASMFGNGGPEIINSEAHDSVIRIKKSVSEKILPAIIEKYPKYKSLAGQKEFFKEQWAERNRIMANNILKAAEQYPGERLVVTTGATHRYILRDLLEHEDTIELKEYWELLDRQK